MGHFGEAMRQGRTSRRRARTRCASGATTRAAPSQATRTRSSTSSRSSGSGTRRSPGSARCSVRAVRGPARAGDRRGPRHRPRAVRQGRRGLPRRRHHGPPPRVDRPQLRAARARRGTEGVRCDPHRAPGRVLRRRLLVRRDPPHPRRRQRLSTRSSVCSSPAAMPDRPVPQLVVLPPVHGPRARPAPRAGCSAWGRSGPDGHGRGRGRWRAVKPYVKVYSRRERAALFSAFRIDRIAVRQVEIGRSAGDSGPPGRAAVARSSRSSDGTSSGPTRYDGFRRCAWIDAARRCGRA